MESSCSIPVFDLDFSILEKKIQEKQYQRCMSIEIPMDWTDVQFQVERNSIDIYQSIMKISDISEIHPVKVIFQSFILFFFEYPINSIRRWTLEYSSDDVSSSDDFSVEHAVADLVEGLELDRTNAQLWCLYLEFSSWHMSTGDLHHLCSAALKNAQSYDLFWTVGKRILSMRNHSDWSI